MAQGDDVRGETGFEQDAPLPVTVQLLDEAVPIDDQARSESAKTRQDSMCVLYRCHSRERSSRKHC